MNPDPRALCAAEKKYGKRNDDISVIQRAAFQEGFIERDAAGPPLPSAVSAVAPESPAPKVGQSICEHGNSEPLTCKRCQETASPPPEGDIKKIGSIWIEQNWKYLLWNDIAPSIDRKRTDCCRHEFVPIEKLAEAKQQGMLDFAAILRNEAHETSPEIARFINKMALSIENEIEPRPTPSKGA